MFCYLTAILFHTGQLEIVKFLVESGATHHITRVKEQVKKLKPETCNVTPQEAKLCQAQKAKKAKLWNSVVEFLDCFQSKHDVDKCRDYFVS